MEQLANRAESTLRVGVSAVVDPAVLLVQVGTGSRFPTSGPFALVIQDAQNEGVYEFLRATSRSGDSITADRAQEGTIPRTWHVGALVGNVVTKGSLVRVIDDVVTVHNLDPGSHPNERLTYMQVVPSDVWIVEHNFGRFPEVSILDAVGLLIEAGIQHVDENIVHVLLSQAITGVAILT